MELHGKSFAVAFIPRSYSQSMYTRSGRRTPGRLGAPPFVDGDDHGIHASAGDDLRTFSTALSTSSLKRAFRVLPLPFGHGLGSHGFNDLTTLTLWKSWRDRGEICRSDGGGTAWCLAASENPT